jgi:hypothetical protein
MPQSSNPREVDPIPVGTGGVATDNRFTPARRHFHDALGLLIARLSPFREFPRRIAACPLHCYLAAADPPALQSVSHAFSHT